MVGDFFEKSREAAAAAEAAKQANNVTTSRVENN
jgi:hypothetical protein